MEERTLQEEPQERKAPYRGSTDVLDVALPCTTRSEVSVDSEVVECLRRSMRLVRRDLNEGGGATPGIEAPRDLSMLMSEARRYYRSTDRERADRFLQLGRIYLDICDEVLLRFSLAQYSFATGRQRFRERRRRDARPYFQVFCHLYARIPTEAQQDLVWEFYNVLGMYFGTYNLYVDVRGSGAMEIADRFYSSFLRMLSGVNRGQLQELGRCFVEIASVNKAFVFDLVNRIKTRGDTRKALPILADSLTERLVFGYGPLCCLQLLDRIDRSKISSAVARQHLSSVDERRLIASDLLQFAHGVSVSPHVILQGLARQASADTKSTLGFSIMVEPFVLGKPAKESELKAQLVVELLGLPTGTQAAEYFSGRVAELSDYFDRFSHSNDPNMKGRYGVLIQDNIRQTRKWLGYRMRGDFEEALTQFFRRLEAYVTAEQAKLIRDTTLELALVGDRALYSSERTRLIVEIRNVGQGTADSLVLEVLPIEGKYDVEDRYRLQRLDIAVDKTPIQREIFIRPLVHAGESLDLSVILRYNTLEEKSKTAELPSSGKTVWLYPATQFVRIAQPYNIGDPATTWFYGRHDLLENMADNLRPDREKPDTSMIVYGLKRAGKTSVVKRFIEHTLEKRGISQAYFPIYVDFLKNPEAQRIKTDDQFLYFLMGVITDALPRHSFQGRLSFSLLSFKEDFKRNSFEAFSFLWEEISRVIAPHRLLVVLDEFSALQDRVEGSEGLTENVFGFLSNVIQGSDQLTFVFTGTYILLEMMRESAFDLAKICTPYMVGFLDDASARRLVEEPVMRDESSPGKGWLEYDSRVIDRIVSVTNCHPYLIQYLCMKLVERMNRLKYNTVNLNDINSLIEDVATKPTHAMPLLTLWNEFDRPQHRVLSVIAAHTRVPQGGVAIDEIADAFREWGDNTPGDEILRICFSLADSDLLEESVAEGSNSYRITVPIYEMWLKQSKPLMAVFSR